MKTVAGYNASSVVFICSVCSALATFWHQISLSSVHAFTSRYDSTLLDSTFYTKSVFAWVTNTFVRFMHIASELLTHKLHMLRWQKLIRRYISQCTCHWLNNLQWIFNSSKQVDILISKNHMLQLEWVIDFRMPPISECDYNFLKPIPLH